MTVGSVVSALVEAADVARLAPSIHNTQPWLWRVAPPALNLYAVRERQLPVSDPGGRLLAMSCGTALHHARLALAAAGWRYTVRRLPDPADADLLARVTAGEHGEADPDALRLLHATRVRVTDRRPVGDTPVDPDTLAAIERAAAAEGVGFHLLHPDQVVELAVTVSHADAIEVQDPNHRAEIARWVGGDRPDGTGIPATALPDQAPQTPVSGRYFFGPPGTLPVDTGHDVAARYAVLHGPQDTPAAWLRAGEALDAAWLVAVEHGVSVLPISVVVEVTGTRRLLREILAGVSHPYLAVRLGRAAPAGQAPPHTPRLPFDGVVDTSALT